MSRNENRFRELMRTATQRRKAGSTRLGSRDGLPSPVSRIQPREDRTQPQARWSQILWLRDGWHAIRCRGVMYLVFLHHHHGQTFWLDLSSCWSRGAYHFKADFPVCDLLKEYSELESKFNAIAGDTGATKIEPMEVVVAAKAVSRGVVIGISKGCVLTDPLAPHLMFHRRSVLEILRAVPGRRGDCRGQRWGLTFSALGLEFVISSPDPVSNAVVWREFHSLILRV